MVVGPLTGAEGGGDGVEIDGGVPAPEFLVANPVASLDLPGLLGPARLDVAEPDPRRFQRESKHQGTPRSLNSLGNGSAGRMRLTRDHPNRRR